MNLKQLEVFINVAESGSFSKGAEATFITQSTVSQHISALENEFGLKLLDRTGKGALLTEGGKLLFERARRLVEYAREITVAVDRFKGVEEAVLRIAGSSIPGEYIIPAALPLLLGKFPGLTLVQVQGDSQDVLDKLKAEQVEFGVVGAAVEDDAVEYTPFAQDHLVLIAPAGHRWATSEAITLEEMLSEPFVLREPGSGTGRAYLNALWKAGIKPDNLRVAAQLGSNEAIKRAVMAGVGVSFVSEISVQREVTQEALVQVPVQGIDIKRQFFLAKRKGRELSPAALAFAGVLQEFYAGGKA
ncbi:LysR family transcriptional regulator [Geomonas limicola]|uniref:LysR family transcriptional regulator n=1 Tax=Geomonas limicola TaxID=2740186 RepID=A0A6V8N293_9BACT|nr:selenium metabolism-associated LysR family transcriptional regulator [Geomonas limicola]GFO66460.1 LysR family transcriptional regulator [Geomonas limicola]